MTRIEKFEDLREAKFFKFNLKSGSCTPYDYCCDGRCGDQDTIYCWNKWTGEIERICRGEMKRYWFYVRDNLNNGEILEVIQTILADRLEKIDKMVDEFYQKREEDMHFSIERWKSGRPVCTRDGEKVKILTTERGGDHPIVALVGEEEFPLTYTLDGKVMSGCLQPEDLRMCPGRNDEWGKVYKEMEEE